MRAKVCVEKINSFPLAFDHQYYLSSLLYERLAESDIRLANETHSSTGFKFYNFSQVIPVDKPIINETGLIFKDGYFILSSPDQNFIRSYAEGLLQRPEFNLGKANLILRSIEILHERKFNGKLTRFKTLSPIYVKTRTEVDGKLKDKDLYPSDGKFYVNLEKNLFERYQEFYQKDAENAHFEITNVHWSKPKRVRIKDNYRRCSLMEFDLDASPELLQFIYNAGLGEKTGVGFGCLEVLM